MPISRAGYGCIGLMILLFVLVGGVVLSDSSLNMSPERSVLRLSGLYGFLLISIAAIMTPYLTQVARMFGKPFIRIHHTAAAFGLALATLHPLSLLNPLMFIPTFQSWILFWAQGGRIALILLYLGLVGGLMRTRWQHWRFLHALMYGVLLFAIVHANLIGTDFGHTGIRWIYNLSFAAVVVTLFLNLWRRRRLNTKKQEAPSRRIPGGAG